MHVVFAVARLFPYWALPLAFIFVELGRFFRRRKQKPQFVCFGLAALLILATLTWIIFRGDLHSDDWVRYFELAS